MRSSNDNTLLLGGLFVLIVVIIALIVYYTRPGETKTPDQTSDTTELKVENLTFERTLNPDPSVGDGVSGYTIEPYGIEYATGATQYMELSKNVTFTMNWTNAPGFDTVVKGFKIEHFVRKPTVTANPTKVEQTLIRTTSNKRTDEKISISDFGDCSAKIVSNGSYSVIGQNSFKLYAVVKKNKETEVDFTNTATQDFVLLYNGIGEKVGEGTSAADPAPLKISKDQLSATMSMTKPETLKYTPARPDNTSSRAIIDKTTYNVTNNTANLNINGNGIYLTTVEGKGGKQYNFTYEDGQYLLDNLTKGVITTTNNRTKFTFEIIDKVGSTGYIRQVSTVTDESKKKYLSSDKDGKLKLYTQTDGGLTQNIFNGFNWTFNERISKMIYFKNENINVFGNPVCISGDDAFIGDPLSYSGKGCVYYYKRSKEGVWEKKSQLTSPSPLQGNKFGCSISASGDYVVIGEEGAKSSSVNVRAGAAHVIMRTLDDSNRNGIFIANNQSRYTLPDTGFVGGSAPKAGDRLGASVAISGDTIVVGVPGRSTNNTGAIRMYKRDSQPNKNIWTNLFDNKVYLNGQKSGSEFGSSVDISGQSLIVGAPKTNHTNGKLNTGAVHIFKNTNDFRETPNGMGRGDVETKIIDKINIANSYLGSSVSISGNDAVVGASGSTNMGGMALTYKTVNGSNWVDSRAKGITLEDGGYGNMIVGNISESVSISGGKIIVGDSTNNKVTVYEKSSDGSGPFWDKSKSISPPIPETGAKFGKSVSSTGGDYVIIGEPSRKKTENGTDINGSFYITNI